ncbi:hypothetical protein ACQEXU_01740 [Vibrio sp. TRT 21S02]|uniref:hypothetical protein n=1 Tax=Vibrio sp. TRT 21S02 TaxID=3418507 RepID=UPI003CFB1D21
MEIGGYDEYRYEQLKALGVQNLDKRLKYLKINEAAEKECMDSLHQMALKLTQASYSRFRQTNSPTIWLDMLREFVSQYKHRQEPRKMWGVPEKVRRLVSSQEEQRLLEQIEMVTALAFYTYNSSRINNAMTAYTTSGTALSTNDVNVWNAYKKWSQNSTTIADAPVYRQMTIPSPQNSAWWKYANDMVNGANPRGSVGVIKSSRYISCSFHKGFIEGACFPEYKNTEGILNFVIRKARGINISAFSGYNSTNQAKQLDTYAKISLGVLEDQTVNGVVDYEKKYVTDVIVKSKDLWFEKRRIKKMKAGYENLAKLMALRGHESVVAVQAEFLLPPSAQLLVNRIIKKPAYPGAANVPVLEVHATYVDSQVRESGTPQGLVPTDQSMFRGPVSLYP